MSLSIPVKRRDTIHEYVLNALPRVGGTVVATFALPSFYSNFNEEQGIIDAELSQAYTKALESFTSELS